MEQIETSVNQKELPDAFESFVQLPGSVWDCCYLVFLGIGLTLLIFPKKLQISFRVKSNMKSFKEVLLFSFRTDVLIFQVFKWDSRLLSNWPILSIFFPDWHLKRNHSVNNIFPVGVTAVHEIPLNQILKEMVCFMTATNESIKCRFWYVYPGRSALSSASFENHLLFVWTVHSHKDETKPFKNPSETWGWKALLLIQALGCAFESCLLRWLWRLSVVSEIQRKQSADPPDGQPQGRLLFVCVCMHNIMSEKLHVRVVETTITLQHQRWPLIPSTFSFTLHDLFNEPCTQHLYWKPLPVSNTSSIFFCPKSCVLCKTRFAFWYFIYQDRQKFPRYLKHFGTFFLSDI